jgi:hypothetical protein
MMDEFIEGCNGIKELLNEQDKFEILLIVLINRISTQEQNKFGFHSVLKRLYMKLIKKKLIPLTQLFIHKLIKVL